MFDKSVYETFVTNGDGLCVDLIVWRRYRRRTPGLVEAIFEINPGLAALGPLLPKGTTIKIPIDTPSSVKTLNVVRLW